VNKISQSNKGETIFPREKDRKDSRNQERDDMTAIKHNKTERQCREKKGTVPNPWFLGVEGNWKLQPQGKPGTPDDNRKFWQVQGFCVSVTPPVWQGSIEELRYMSTQNPRVL
jgi:hypothetical protein